MVRKESPTYSAVTHQASVPLRGAAEAGGVGDGLSYLAEGVSEVVSQKSIPAKSVNISFIITDIKDKLTNLCRN